MARERTKARISYLEDLVEEFRKQDSSGRVASLMQQLQDTVKERDELAKTIKFIESSIKGNRAFAKSASPDTPSTRAIPSLGSVPTSRDARRDLSTLEISRVPQSVSAANEDGFISSPDTELAMEIAPDRSPDQYMVSTIDEVTEHPALKHELAPYVSPDMDVIFPPSRIACDCCRTKTTTCHNQPANLWRFANETLAKRETYPDETLELEDAFGDDIPIRAMLEGWDAVEARMGGALPPMWQRLRRIDEGIFRSCGNTERLAIIRVMHLLLRYHAQPTPKRKQALPNWYLRRQVIKSEYITGHQNLTLCLDHPRRWLTATR